MECVLGLSESGCHTDIQCFTSESVTKTGTIHQGRHVIIKYDPDFLTQNRSHRCN